MSAPIQCIYCLSTSTKIKGIGWSTNYQSDLFFSDDSLSNKLSFGNGNNIYRTLQLDFFVAISIKYINCLVG